GDGVDRQARRADRQAAGDVADGVVGETAAERRAGRDRVRAAGHGRAGGGAGAGQRDAADGVAGDQAAGGELGAAEGDRGAVRLGPVGGGDGQALGGDREAGGRAGRERVVRGGQAARCAG